MSARGRTIRRYGGVDFDLGGALAVLGVDRGIIVEVDIYQTPTIGRGGSRREYDISAMCSMVSEALALPNGGAQTNLGGVLVEEAHAMPSRRGGSFANFLRGRGSAAWEAALCMIGAPKDTVKPAAWKKTLNLRGGKGGKRESIAKAKSLVPMCAEHLRIEKDHGKAEAVLLAYLAWQRWGKT